VAGTLWTDPVRVLFDQLDTAVIEVLDAEAAVTLRAGDVKTIFEGLASLLIFDQFFQNQTIEDISLARVGVVDFDAVNLGRCWVNDLVPLAIEVTLGVDHVALYLLAVVTEVHRAHLVAVLDLHAL